MKPLSTSWSSLSTMLRSAPFLHRTVALVVVRLAIDQATQKRLKVGSQNLGVARLGVDECDPRLTLRSALAVVEKDPVVPGRRGHTNVNAHLGKSGLFDHVPAAEVLGINAPRTADPADLGNADVIIRPARAPGRVALPLRHAAVFGAQQPQVRLRQSVSN